MVQSPAAPLVDMEPPVRSALVYLRRAGLRDALAIRRFDCAARAAVVRDLAHDIPGTEGTAMQRFVEVMLSGERDLPEVDAMPAPGPVLDAVMVALMRALSARAAAAAAATRWPTPAVGGGRDDPDFDAHIHRLHVSDETANWTFPCWMVRTSMAVGRMVERGLHSLGPVRSNN
jgi:hypothetical protein